MRAEPLSLARRMIREPALLSKVSVVPLFYSPSDLLSVAAVRLQRIFCTPVEVLLFFSKIKI